MKRTELLKHLNEHGCVFLREGGCHSWWSNPALNKRSSVPRHTEIRDHLARKICKDLGIPFVKLAPRGPDQQQASGSGNPARLARYPTGGSLRQKERRPQTPTGDPVGMEPSSERNLNNPRIVLLAGRCGIISRSARLSDEERIPSARSLSAPEGEAVPEREKRVQGAWSTTGRVSEAGKRLPRREVRPTHQRKTGYARPCKSRNATTTPHREVQAPQRLRPMHR